MAQAILADTFPPEKRGLAFSVYGITAVIAPTIGPTLGGWITYNYSWRWIFYINLPIGILAVFLVIRMVEDPPYLRQMRAAGVRLDYIGLAFLAIGIGALQVVLDKGQEDDWFGSRFILTLSVIAAICLISLIVDAQGNPVLAEKAAEALDALKADGSYDKLLGKFHHCALPGLFKVSHGPLPDPVCPKQAE